MNSSDEPKGTGNPQAGAASSAPASIAVTAVEKAKPRSGGGGKTPPPPPPPGDDSDGEDDGMLRMSFLQHLEELRARIIKALWGVAAAFVISLTLSNELWNFVSQPAVQALKTLGYAPTLKQITPMESFNVIWFKLPVLCAIFLGTPWVLYQVWAFIAAAVVTPTPDVFNMMLFAVPMCLLIYVGIFAGYLLVLHRENRRFPWRRVLTIVLPLLLLLAVLAYIAITRHAIKLVPHWPFVVR